MTTDQLVHIAQTVIVLVFLGARWLERREGGERVTAAQLAEVKAAIAEKADCDRVTDLEALVQREHDDRRRLADHMHATMGQLTVTQAAHAERLKAVERDVGELRRLVFDGGQSR